MHLNYINVEGMNRAREFEAPLRDEGMWQYGLGYTLLQAARHKRERDKTPLTMEEYAVASKIAGDGQTLGCNDLALAAESMEL